MHDQASDLRQLVRQSAAEHTASAGGRPYLITVTSGKGGVGTTTIAVNLAVAMARAGQKTVLVDADPDGGDVAVLCGLEERYTLADVFSGRRTIGEVFQRGPASLQILPGLWGLEKLADFPPSAAERFLGQLQGLGRRADLIVLDAGNSLHRMMRHFWYAADLRLAVTTAETPSILDTYALIKALLQDNAVQNNTAGPIHSLVNQAPDAELARSVHRRLARACRRFLGVPLQSAGHIPIDPQLATAAPGSPAGVEVARLAKALAPAVGHQETSVVPFQFEQDQLTRMMAG